MNALRDLNVNFNQFNIFFKYYGMDQINETDYLIIENSNELNQLINSSYSIPNAINIYIVNGSVAGAAARVYTFDDDFFVRQWTICHEIGHLFGLVHPYFIPYNLPVGLTWCDVTEHATRNNSDPDFNATTRGDQVVDTHSYVFDSSKFDSNCIYIGGAFDCLGVPIVNTILPNTNGYQISPQINNFMDENESCLPIFTPGQGIRMREAITGYWANTFNSWMNTVESLYQPFESTEVAGNNIVSVTDNHNGTATVCRSIVRRDRFQKGFDCVFYNMNNNVIDSSIPDDLKVISERTFDYKVKIAQVDSTNTEIVTVVCTKGVICNTEPYISGKILSMQVLGSMNITVKELNEAQVNDPNLFDQLMEQYYHIIRKETESGAIDEKIIYKN